MAEAGYVFLVLTLIAGIAAAIFFILGKLKGSPILLRNANIATIALFSLATASILVLLFAILGHHFEIEYVASYTSRSTPTPYLISALWAGDSGSILLWAWVLGLFAFLCLKKKDPYAMTTIMAVEIFLFMLVIVTNPFARLSVPLEDGMGINPLLEHPAMLVHPPAILAGYAGVTVVFAFAISALLEKRFDRSWLDKSHAWAVLSWLLLGVGNLLGAWWAYVELGWGGYWAWDPVENAGLMPWLVMTAFLHSAITSRKEGLLNSWSIRLAITSFILVIFGTFITRTDILSSVHTFGQTAMSSYLSAFLIISVVGSLVLYLLRRKDIKEPGTIKTLLSKEGMLLLTNFFFLGSALIILIGTIFPAITELITGTKATTGAEFFNSTAVPLFVAIILLLALCSLVSWQKALSGRSKELGIAAGSAAIITIILVATGIGEWYVLTASFVAAFALIAILIDTFRRTNMAKRNWGAYVIHLAIIIMAIGIIGSSAYDRYTEITLAPGESANVSNYTLTYNQLELQGDERRMIIEADVSVLSNNHYITTLKPQRAVQSYWGDWVWTSEVAIRSTPVEDLYLALLDWDENENVLIGATINPLIMWLWIGGGIFLAGGLLLFWPRKG